MRPLTIINPNRLVFGNGCLNQLILDLKESLYKNIFVVTFPQLKPLIIDTLVDEIKTSGKMLHVDESISSEPTIDAFKKVLNSAFKFKTDCVVGIGGGSVMDVAKLVAALCDKKQSIEDVIGIDLLKARQIPLICVPTTSGTGSEMSPNAIIMDESDQLKKGVISRFLVPDASYIDPLLTKSVPSAITATTGIDALSHCLEAYANKFAHPIVDLYALEGIRLVAANLKKVIDDGTDDDARANLALASMYGGMCLGPVNTAAIHAIAYPLGSEFHIAHGLSIAVLMPHVMKFNSSVEPKRFAKIGLALGVETGKDDYNTAQSGIQKLKELMKACGIPQSIKDLGISEQAIGSMAESAMKVARLLKNNLREVTIENVEQIYQEALRN